MTSGTISFTIPKQKNMPEESLLSSVSVIWKSFAASSCFYTDTNWERTQAAISLTTLWRSSIQKESGCRHDFQSSLLCISDSFGKSLAAGDSSIKLTLHLWFIWKQSSCRRGFRRRRWRQQETGSYVSSGIHGVKIRRRRATERESCQRLNHRLLTFCFLFYFSMKSICVQVWREFPRLGILLKDRSSSNFCVRSKSSCCVCRKKMIHWTSRVSPTIRSEKIADNAFRLKNVSYVTWSPLLLSND